MQVTAMEILGSGGLNRPMMPLDVELDTAFALYCEKRWPVGRRKAVEREWGLSVDEARAVVEAKASKRIISKILKHPRGGWAVVLPVLGAVIGEPIDAFFRDQMKQAAREARQAHEHEQLAQAAYRRLESPAAAPSEDRRTWSAPGEMGAATPRRVAGG
jgi:hypothetical protein